MDPIMETTLGPSTDRRNFLKWSGGALLAGGLLLESCKKKDDDNTPTPTTGNLTLTNDDVGILNYAYALEQLEADFYAKVVADSAFTTIFMSGEQELLKDIAAHEKAHREFFAAAIPAASRLANLTTKYNGVNFGDRTSVLTTAKTFEDLGVSAYNGAGIYIQSADYLVLAGKIVSVEARHAAFIRELLGGSRFVDSDVVAVDYSKMPGTFKSPISKGDGSMAPLTATELGFSATNNSIEKSKKPSEVLAAAGAFINETLINKLP